MNNIIKSASLSLKEIFEEYKFEGINSIYLWGSVLTEDFDEENSDVDSIAIVSESFDQLLEEKIRIRLNEDNKEIKQFGFRVLYEEELKQGKHIRSDLSSFISPKLLLLDLSDWMLIAGKNYLQKDFNDKLITYKEAINLRLKRINETNWEKSININKGEEQYYVKELWRILHLLQLIRGNNYRFSYSSILIHANEKEKNVAKMLKEVKDSNYNRKLLLKHSDELDSFIDGVKSYIKKS